MDCRMPVRPNILAKTSLIGACPNHKTTEKFKIATLSVFFGARTLDSKTLDSWTLESQLGHRIPGHWIPQLGYHLAGFWDGKIDLGIQCPRNPLSRNPMSFLARNPKS